MQQGIYKHQGIGALHIMPHQENEDTRRIETDNGKETVLSIQYTPTSLSIEIIQLNEELRERVRSRKWTIPLDLLAPIPIVKRHDDSWSFVAADGTELELYCNPMGGDMEMRVYNFNARDLRSQVPPFEQVTSGGKSDSLRQALGALKKKLQQDSAAIEVNKSGMYHVELIQLYEAIGKEWNFKGL